MFLSFKLQIRRDFRSHVVMFWGQDEFYAGSFGGGDSKFNGYYAVSDVIDENRHPGYFVVSQIDGLCDEYFAEINIETGTVEFRPIAGTAILEEKLKEISFDRFGNIKKCGKGL